MNPFLSGYFPLKREIIATLHITRYSVFEVDESCRGAKCRMANDFFEKLKAKSQRLKNVHPSVHKKRNVILEC